MSRQLKRKSAAVPLQRHFLPFRLKGYAETKVARSTAALQVREYAA